MVYCGGAQLLRERQAFLSTARAKLSESQSEEARPAAGLSPLSLSSVSLRLAHPLAHTRFLVSSSPLPLPTPSHIHPLSPSRLLSPTMLGPSRLNVLILGALVAAPSLVHAYGSMGLSRDWNVKVSLQDGLLFFTRAALTVLWAMRSQYDSDYCPCTAALRARAPEPLRHALTRFTRAMIADNSTTAFCEDFNYQCHDM